MTSSSPLDLTANSLLAPATITDSLNNTHSHSHSVSMSLSPSKSSNSHSHSSSKLHSSGSTTTATKEFTFHQQSYLLTVHLHSSEIDVEIESKSAGDRWFGCFSSTEIESMTSKTGNFKPFGLFSKMLLQSILQQSKSVFIELLTRQDLESLHSRQRGGGNLNDGPTGKSAPPNVANRRYLILTYLTEFDRVHYPLPLKYEDSPSVESLKKTIQRLAEEIQALKLSGAQPNSDFASIQREISALQDENRLLKNSVKNSRVDLNDSAGRSALHRETAKLAAEQEILIERQTEEIKSLKHQLHSSRSGVNSASQLAAEQAELAITRLTNQNEKLNEKLKSLLRDQESMATRAKAEKTASAQELNRERKRVRDLELANENMKKELEREKSRNRLMGNSNSAPARKPAARGRSRSPSPVTNGRASKLNTSSGSVGSTSGRRSRSASPRPQQIPQNSKPPISQRPTGRSRTRINENKTENTSTRQRSRTPPLPSAARGRPSSSLNNSREAPSHRVAQEKTRKSRPSTASSRLPKNNSSFSGYDSTDSAPPTRNRFIDRSRSPSPADSHRSVQREEFDESDSTTAMLDETDALRQRLARVRRLQSELKLESTSDRDSVENGETSSAEKYENSRSQRGKFVERETDETAESNTQSPVKSRLANANAGSPQKFRSSPMKSHQTPTKQPSSQSQSQSQPQSLSPSAIKSAESSGSPPSQLPSSVSKSDSATRLEALKNFLRIQKEEMKKLQEESADSSQTY